MNVSHCLSSRWPGHDSSVRGWMYLPASPPCGPGHDSSVGEWIYLAVSPLHGPGDDSPVEEWMHLTACPLRGSGGIPIMHFKVFQEMFPWLITHTEEMGAANSLHTHWKDTWNMKQYSFFCCATLHPLIINMVKVRPSIISTGQGWHSGSWLSLGLVSLYQSDHWLSVKHRLQDWMDGPGRLGFN